MGAHYPQPLHLRAAKTHFLQQWSAPEIGLQWRLTKTTWLRLPDALLAEWTALSGSTYANQPAQIRSFWTTFPWTFNDWIRDAMDNLLRPHQYPTIQCPTIGDLQLRQLEPGLFHFNNPLSDPYRMRQSTIKTLARWLSVIVTNSAFLFGDTTSATMRVYSCTTHPTFDKYEWTIHENGQIFGRNLEEKWVSMPVGNPRPRLRAEWNGWLRPLTFSPCDDDNQTLTDLDCLRQGAPVILAGHPFFQHGPTFLPVLPVSLSGMRGLPTITRTILTPHLSNLVPGFRRLIDRLDRQVARTPIFSAALQHLSLKQVRTKAHGITSQQHLFWYRLVLGAHNLRGAQGEALSCPHAGCPSSSPLTMQHVVWDCPGAHTFWTLLWERWTGERSDTNQTAHSRMRAVLTRSPPPVHHSLMEALGHVDPDYAGIQHTLKLGWLIICTVACQCFWLARNAAAFDGRQVTSVGLARTTWATVDAQLAAISHPITLLEEHMNIRPQLLHTLRILLATERPTTTTQCHSARLYFDGGARGNPGPGGSGSVLVIQDPDTLEWTIVWWDSHFIGQKTTNNQAEHTGVLRGLQERQRRCIDSSVSLTVIGDSELILAQLTGTARYAKASLQRVANRSNQILSGFVNTRLRHTLRNGNKMADFLANHAMDTSHTTSRTTAWTPTDVKLAQLLQNDIQHGTTELREALAPTSPRS